MKTVRAPGFVSGTRRLRGALRARVLLPAIAVLNLSGCALGDGGGSYGYYGGGYNPGYYEPYGYEVGGWGGGYGVGPGRGGERRGGRDHGHEDRHGGGQGDGRAGHAQAAHTYRAAPSGRGSPSIPSHAHRN